MAWNWFVDCETTNCTRATPVIVLTASPFEHSERAARAVGCDAFLLKPCLPDALAAEIRRVLAARKARRRSLGSCIEAATARYRLRNQPSSRK